MSWVPISFYTVIDIIIITIMYTYIFTVCLNLYFLSSMCKVYLCEKVNNVTFPSWIPENIMNLIMSKMFEIISKCLPATSQPLEDQCVYICTPCHRTCMDLHPPTVSCQHYLSRLLTHCSHGNTWHFFSNLKVKQNIPKTLGWWLTATSWWEA